MSRDAAISIPEVSLPPCSDKLLAETLARFERGTQVTGAILSGTAEGMAQCGRQNLAADPARTALEGLGSVSLGVALAAGPRWLTVTGSVLGGIGMAGYIPRAAQSCKTVIGLAGNENCNLDTIRSAASRELGGLAFEAATMIGISSASAAMSHAFLRRPVFTDTAGLACGQPVLQDSGDGIQVYTRELVDPHLNYPRRHEEFIGFNRLKEIPELGEVVGQTKYTQWIRDDKNKSKLIENFRARHACEGIPDGYLGIPLLSRVYNDVGVVLKPFGEPGLAQKYLSARGSIVKIERYASGKLSGELTGFALSRDGQIATSAHGIKDNCEFKVKTPFGKEYPARTVVKDVEKDIAILKVDDKDARFIPMKLAGSSLVTDNPKVLLFGHPRGAEAVFASPGVLNRLRRVIRYEKQDEQVIWEGEPYTQCSYFVQAHGGNSGSPVLNDRGEVIAVHCASDYYGQSFQTVQLGYGTAVEELVALKQRADRLLTLCAQKYPG